MTNEEKELLLKDISARLPYGVFCDMGLDYPLSLQSLFVDRLDGILLDFYEDGKDYQVYLGEVKPYLFPLSSMTPKQKAELAHLTVDIDGIFERVLAEIEFYHRHHIDYRGLIEMGLAIDATGLGIYE